MHVVCVSVSPDIIDGGSEVVGPVSERTVQAILHAVAAGVRLVYARPRLVVAEVVLALRVTGGAV